MSFPGWETYLKGSKPCQFPRLGSPVKGSTAGLRQTSSARVEVKEADTLLLLSTADTDTLGAVLLTAWALLLQRYTGQDDVSFSFQHRNGDVVARFLLGDSASVVGTVEHAKTVLPNDLPPVPTQLIRPGDSGPPLFDTAVVLWNFTTNSAPCHALAPEQHKLRLLVKRGETSLSLFLEWSSVLLGMSATQGALVATTLDTILSGLLTSQPDAPLTSLDYVSSANVDRVCEWNSNSSIQAVDRFVHDVIADQSLEHPDAEAVCAWDGRLTYHELDRVAQHLAGRLVQLGVGPEVLVPLCFEKSKWTPIAMLAVLKAGGAFVPLDPSHPADRLRGLCESVGAKLMLCSNQLTHLLTGVVETVLPVDDGAVAESTQTEDWGKQKSVPTTSSSNAAYVIFTSGSTGKPKGTVIEHRAFCSSAQAHAPALRIDGTCRVLQFAAHTFDASLVEILTSLMVGACVCIPSEQERLSDIAGAMNRMRVDHAVLTPSFVNFLTPAAVPGLRRLVLAGEAMSRSHVATWSHIELVNGYGPAESSVAAVVNPNVGVETEPTDIGMPCGVRVWLVDPVNYHRLVPVGCAGEILLEGPSLARGYLNDPSKTMESFISDPAWAQQASQDGQVARRFYRTGDLARYNSDSGSLSYIGRKDTQIKLHGQRIELGEIEHHLAVDESVQHALVLLPKSGPLAKRLITVLSLCNPPTAPTSCAGPDSRKTGDLVIRLAENLHLTEPILEHIRGRLGGRLPAYMVPSAWICVEGIPMLPSKKMDRKSVATWVECVLTTEQCQAIIRGLNAPDSTTSKDGENTQPILTEVEIALRDIWSLVLNFPADQIRPDDRSFLSLGGDSISAMACASRAKKTGLGVTVQDILKAKSLKQLAAAAKPVSQPTPRQQDLEDGTVFSLSPIQQFHFKVRGEAQSDEHFNQSFCLRLARRVEKHAVRKAIQAVVKRHAMLRARFAQGEDGQWHQSIAADVETSYRFRTHTIQSRADADAGISNAQACLDVRQGPLFAAELFVLQDMGQQILFMTAHHLVIDLVSWRVILEEIEEILENPLTDLGSIAVLSFRDWTSIQINACGEKPLSQILPSADQVPEAQFSFWGMHNQPNLYGDVACESFELDALATSSLLSECHTPFNTETVDLLITALMWSFQVTFPDRLPPAIFNEGHGRESPREEIDIARTVGWFTTLFPIALSSPTTFAEALVQTKDLRRRVPGNGRPYFAARFHSPEARERWGTQHGDMEVSFNFLGRYQQLERANSLFQPAEGAHMAGEAHPGSPTADFGHAAPRFSLFEISAVIVHGALRFGFAWNRQMLHQERIHQWVASCRAVLVDAASTLPGLARRPTPSDFGLIPGLCLADLDIFEQTRLPVLTDGRNWDAVEDIYPASPIQQGLLLSRTKDATSYAVRREFRIKPNGAALDGGRVVRAWKRVVQHHALLRTVFVDTLSQARAGAYDQVVLSDVEPPMLIREFGGNESEMQRLAQALEPMEYRDDRPQHRFSVLHSANSIFCVLEISHVIMDGASMDILLRDLGRAYDGSLETLPKPLFSPFVASLQQRSVEADMAFWTSYLFGLEPCHFPVLNDDVNMSETDRKLCTLQMEVPGLAALQDFCSGTGFTLPNVFHAAWALTLACYVGTNDVCFGYLVSGRDTALIEGSVDAVGPFINMATQRVKLDSEGDGQLTVLQLLEAVQKGQLDSMPYSQASLAEVQHVLNLPGGMALFNTCISYRRRQPEMEKADSSIVCEDSGTIHDPTEYPISLNIEIDNKSGAVIDLDYWTNAVSTPQAKHVAATFLQALSNISEHTKTPIVELDTVHPTTKQAIWAWNSNMPATTADCVHRMVERQVALRPQAQAIRGWDANFSYEEMNALANRLAQYLFDLGVGPETLVPVCFDKSAWTTISMLAVLKAGAGVVPLDATHPAHALEAKVTDSGAHVVVASEARAVLFKTMVPYVVAVGPGLLDRLLAEADGKELASGVTAEHPAFIMFTSGSTGSPKGVVLCHQALVSSALAHGSALGLGPHTRFLQFAAHTFDNSLEEMFTTLIHGGCVCVPSDADRLSDLPGAIDKLDANFMDLTPTVAALLRPEQAPKIRGIAVGGEALTREVLNAWGGVIPVHNQYGPSECSINATHKLHLERGGDVGNIGTSVGSVSWVVNPQDHNQLVPVGCAGELLIEGPILARGYLGRPAETAKAFIEMPKWASADPRHAQRGNRRMYKTGDLVRYSSEGSSLVYLGRKDTQVKLHGQRIELGEIEHHVKINLPTMAQSSVELVALGQTKVLAVFFCLSPSENEETRILAMDTDLGSICQTIVGAMTRQLASYMVPSLFLPMSRMPLTSSGKLDRRHLRTMAQALGENIVEYRPGAGSAGGRAPETLAEKHLQELWASVLSVPARSISANDSFFSHGGDSVGAMRLVAAARQRGIFLTVASIFQWPKLSDLANTATGRGIDDGSKPAHSSASTVVEDDPLPGPLKPFSLLSCKGRWGNLELQEHVASICRVDIASIEDIYPCTPLQAGLVAVSQSQLGAYVAVNFYELPVGIDIPRFKKAWQEVVDSESILRTRIVFVESIGFLQVVIQEKIVWETAPNVDGLCNRRHRQLPPHDGGILSRYTIIGEHASRPTFAWTAHHALYDGWSLPTLLGRVEARYRRPEMPMIPSPHYSRFIEYISGLEASASDAFWIAKLSSPGAAHFPQLPHPGYHAQATSQVSRAVRFIRPKGASLTSASFLRAAWALVVSLYAFSDDIVFGEILNGRDVPLTGVEDLVGPTLASVPRRIRINRAMSIQQMLVDVQTQLNDAMPHQFAGLQRIKALGPAAAAACEFRNLFAVDVADEAPQGSLWSNMEDNGSAQGPDFFSYPLNLTCTLARNSEDEAVLVRAVFDAKVVPQWLVTRMLGQFETILSRLSNPESQHAMIGDVDLLSPEDKKMLHAWNRTPGPRVERRVHDMVCEQMAKQGHDATAVVSWDMTLSNGELDTLSSVLAGELVRVGVGADGSRFVPFCFEKSALTVVAMLAVLKAGAAFVPLSPAHPVSRLREIIGDCQAEVVLCSPKYENLCSEVVGKVVPVDMAMLKKCENTTTTAWSFRAHACLPNDAAYAIYTSGTTGKAKGIIISHTAFCSGAAAHGPAMLMTPPFRFLQFASYTFDACLVEILTTLLMGGTVCVPREEDRTNGNIAKTMEQMGVTMALLTPSFARALEPPNVPHLQTLILGGEAMAQSHLSTWADKVNLVNAYGPSECAVVAAANPQMRRSSNPANLGRGLGRCWIVDPQNHNRLAPLGSVGELVIEGPTLSTGYLRNDAKTREVFVENPRWALDAALRYPDMLSRVPRRMYKTGDLVRVLDDSGEMAYIGRKDSSQAKLNGQRLELDEIAHHLSADDAIRHAVVVLPRAGPCAKRLVAVISLQSGDEVHAAAQVELVTSGEAFCSVDKIQERLRAKLPPYMIPSTWMVLHAIPLLPSGKLDRNTVIEFVDSISEMTIDHINAARSASQEQEVQTSPAVQNLPIGERLKSIWSQVLNIGSERIDRNISFLHLGGDSITAMQVMAKCRAQGIRVAVPDIIGSKSVYDLALKAHVPRLPQEIAATGEDHHEFDPSPIQQLYFQLMRVGNSGAELTGSHNQFNQSVLLRLARNTNPDELKRGLHALVETHSMLRARFRRDGTGSWRQRLTSDIGGSYRFKTHAIGNEASIEKRIQNSQRTLDIRKGPVFAADWFNVGKEKKEVYIFFTAHHLVVDVVSWGILLQDLEDFLSTGNIRPPTSLSFQAWSRAQSERARAESNGPGLLPHREASDTDLEYWGMTGVPNVYGDVVVSGDIDLDSETTRLLLGPECNTPLKTEVLDVLLAALLVSYRNTFRGRRGVATIYNEGHGRETWNDAMDLSRTVGWFTTLYPVHLPDESSADDDLLGAIRWVKDYRGRLPGKGRPYFAYQLLTSQGREEYGHRWPVEVAFNYLGQMQQLGRADTFLQALTRGVGKDVNSSSDIGSEIPRFALAEVSAVVVDGRMKLSFAHNKHMKHQDSLQRWVTRCQSLLQEAPRRLIQHTPETTLSAFPLLPLAYYGLDNLEQRLRDIGVSFIDVENVYPCSPMQRGLLLSQMRDPEKYRYKVVFQVECSRGADLDLQKLSSAWQAVVCQHSTLRTIFVDTVGDEGLMDQVVLRSAPGRIQMLNCAGDEEALQTLHTIDYINYNEKKPPHCLTLCKTTGGRALCRLEISHAISDGSSVPLLLDDLVDAYDSGAVNRPVVPYHEFIAYLQSQLRSESVSYWKDYLGGSEPCLFPTLADGASDEEPSLGTHAISLRDMAKVNAYCMNSGITLSTLLQFSWALVVRSYTGADEVLFGYLVSGRDIPVQNIDHAVGAFINMLVCRLQLSAVTEVGEALDTMRADLAEGMVHQTCSLAEMQHELRLPCATLFNTAFTYQKRTEAGHGRGHRSPETALKYTVVSAEDPSEYAIAVNVEAMEKAVEVHFSYWRNIVSDAQIKNVAATFEQALRDLVSNAADDRTVGELDLVGSEGVEKIRAWNDHELPRVDQCVHDVIERHALQSPASTPAVCGWDASFTYRELDAAAADLARHLVTSGVGPEVFVPLCFEKSAWTVVAQLAVLKAGGAFVNLDPSHPDSRMREIIQDVDARIVLCSAKHKAKIDKIASRAFVVDAESSQSFSKTASRGALFTSTAKPTDPAYIILTSGTTGKPKSCVIEHAAFCTGALAHADAMFMRPGSRVLQFASYTFDASIMETLSCLLVGGCVCVPSDEERMDDLAAVIRNMGVTWTLLTPSVASTVKPETVPGLKTLVTGGEAMAAGHIARWGTQCALVNAYGPTECSVVATTSVKVDESHQVRNADCSNIGTAVGGRVWVVDPHTPDRLVPIGAVGELVVEGRLVARGYLNNQEQTDNAFIRSPKWAQHPGFPKAMWLNQDRMYRTGDLVRYNSEFGSISYISRKDTQIKLNGRRIELGEIEFHCRAGLPDDAQCAVEVISLSNNRATTKSLAVFFTLPVRSPTQLTGFSLLPMDEPLRQLALATETHLTGHLPAYMIPQLFVPVSAMPWTSAGKLDRRQLRQTLEGMSRELRTGYRLTAAAARHRGPSSEMEKTLQALWEGVLGLPTGSVGAGDSFFRLGGDSLTAMRLVGAARAHKVSLTVLDVFDKPVLADMAQACGGLDTACVVSPMLKPFDLVACQPADFEALIEEVSSQCQLPRAQIQDMYPCSPLQEGLVTLANKQAGAYVAVNTLKLPLDVDLDCFKAAWQEVVDETDTLRTRIVHTAASGFLQVVVAPEPIDWHHEPLLKESVAAGKAIGLQNGGTLTRYSVVVGAKDQNEERIFAWAIHHALYDGWSLRLLARRVQDVYNSRASGFGRVSGTHKTNNTTRASFANFIQYLEQSNTAASEEFWRDSLKGASSVAHFPHLAPAIMNQGEASFRTETHTLNFQRSGILIDITVPTLIRASWAIVLGAYTGVDDVVFGETLAGRNIDVPGVAEIAGPTFTTVPTRVQLNRELRVVDFLLGLHSMASRVALYQHLGLQRIKRLDPDCAGACGFQNLLVIQTSSSTPASSQQNKPHLHHPEMDWDFQEGSSSESFFTHPLVLECTITDNAIEAAFHYDGKVLSQWHTNRLAHQFEAVLKRLVEKSGSKDATMADIHVISAGDQALIARWNRKNTCEEVNSCIHQLFLDQATARPQDIAVSAWDAELTFSEVRDYASRLALHLNQHGVKRETLVPVCLERSAWSVVAIIGILLAGGAFVPLAPAHPLTRQKQLLESIKAGLILCSPEHASRFASVVGTRIAVDGGMLRSLPPQDQTPLPILSSPINTAYVLYTSGSTGAPKGVVVAHRDFCSSSRAYADVTHMTASSRVFHFSSLTFDAALMEVLTPLTLGACVCVPTAHDRLHDLGDTMARMRVTWSFLTPSVANLVDPKSVPTLKTLVCGGEAMLAQTISRWADCVELVNAYGPTETCVIAAANPRVSAEKDPSIIGRGTAAACLWVVESREGCNDRLAPVGAVGELAVSGPLLARGYLNEPKKTARAFVDSPAWAKKGFLMGTALPKRIYRTGDLVRYRDADGSLEFLGRSDSQVKVNGQRIELGEIESRLSADPNVRLGLVVQPKTGPCKKQLVGVLTLTTAVNGPTAAIGAISSDSTTGSVSCNPVTGSPDQLAQLRSGIAKIRDLLADTLPHYMIPAAWIVLESLPVVVSGKLDRQKVTRWVEDLDDAAYERIASSVGINAGDGNDDESQVTGLVKTLREICARELNLPADRIKLNQPFLSLGGDSIRAMGLVSRARNVNIKLSIQDVLRSKSIIHLSQLAKEFPSSRMTEVHGEEQTEQPFGLSPIQSLYLRSAVKHNGDARFNQSITLGVSSHHVTIDTVKRAINSIVQRHTMLRVRLSKTLDGNWEQQIAKMGPSTYYCGEHHLGSRNQMAPILATAQTSLCIEHGPVFRADIFDQAGQTQIFVSMVAHHLCIDMVSWRIIVQDLTRFFETGSLVADSPLSFRSWLTQQSSQSKTVDSKSPLPFIKETLAGLAYWGMQMPLTYGRTETRVFILDEETTRLALLDCHRTFRSEPVDLFLAAIGHSFATTFQDRSVPTIHIESHGRESPEGSAVDLSRTVGWFTTICPLVVPVHAGDNDVLDTLRRTKDTRRSIGEHGRPPFARNHFGEVTDAEWTPMEVLFNFLGGGVGGRQPEHADSLIYEVDLHDIQGLDSSSIADVGPQTRRLALFEISAIVINNRLQFSFVYDSSLGRANQVREWISACKNTLEKTTRVLAQRPAEPTLCDYPLLPLAYDDLRALTDVALPRVGINRASFVSRVEDIYPCTPVQEGMLISQLRNPRAYIFHAVYSVKHTNPSHRLSAERIAGAWQKIVDRHAALRTVFIESVRRGGVFDQVVLKNADSGVVLIRSSDEEAMNKLSAVTIQTTQPHIPHRLAICTTHSGKMLVKLEVNHAAMDGGSLAIIFEELASEYIGTLESSAGPLYSDYVRHVRSLPEDTGYWKGYLDGLQPCYFPSLNPSTTTLASDTRNLRTVALQFDRYPDLRQLAERKHVTLANIMHAAWGFVLRKYTERDDVCFGYLTAGRDAPIENIDRTVGTLINMLCCRVQISRSQRLEDIFQVAQDHHLQSMQYQHCSLARVQHELGLAGKPLYNTSISTQNHADEMEREAGETLKFDMETGHDPSEYAITVNIETSKNNEGVVFRYWSDHVSDDQAQEVARSMAGVLDAFVNRPRQSVEQFDMALGGNPATTTESVQDVHSDSGPESPRSIDSPSPRTSSEHSLETPVDKPAGQSTLEKTLLALWSSLLALPEDSITEHDSFFDLGGDSITAMKLAGEARDCGMPLTVADVFRHPSFNSMASSLRAAADLHVMGSKLANHKDGTMTPESNNSDLYERFSLVAASNVDAFLQTSIVPQVCVFRGGISDVLPATDFQSLSVAGALLESRWMLNHFYLDGEGLLNLVQLKRACFRLVQSLDILRTVFVPSGGRFLQVVLRTLRPAFHIVETDEPVDEYMVGNEGGAPQLGEPFVEFTVIRHTHSTRHRLVLRISHAQYDGVCFPRILDALQAAYGGGTISRPPSFANYLRASAVSLTSEHYQHWKKLLTGASMTEVVRRQGPNYHRNSSGAATACLKKSVCLPAVESGHITTATIIKAAWAYVLAQVSATADVVFGHTISGRNAAVEGVGNMVGPCLNLVPVRVQFGNGPDRTVKKLLLQVQDQQVANMSHEVLGFREIIRHCTSWPRWTYFTSTVQHQNIDQSGSVRLGDIDYRIGCASAAQEDFADLSVLSQPLQDDNMFEIILSFSESGAIPRDFAERVLDMLCEAARLFATDPDATLPSAAELCSKAQEIPFGEVSTSSMHSNHHNRALQTTSHLQNLSQAQLRELWTLVDTTWRQVLDSPEHQAATTTPEESGTGLFGMDRSFFALGGDIIGLAQLAWLLGQGGFAAPRLEDLVNNPTMRGHMALLAKGIIPTPTMPVEAAMELQKAATFPVMQRITRVDSSLNLAKALKMVKKRWMKRKGGDAVVVV